MQIKTYRKDSEYSYSLGVFPTLELIEYKTESVIKVLISSKGKENTGVKKLIEICLKKGIDYEVSDKTINRLSKKENVYAVGVFNKYEEKITDGNHLVLVNPGDMGNLGTIIRTCLGFGIENIGIILPGVDRFDPKAIRGSMGAIFKAKIEYFSSFEEYMDRFPSNKRYAFMLNAESYLEEVEISEDARESVTLIFGNESSGLDEEYFSSLAESIKIRQTDKIDSLNLAVSIGIALYKFQTIDVIPI